jgi:phosphohistidine phosphatase
MPGQELELRILRHAKSDWGEGESNDRERGLNARGKRDAPRMGRALAQRFAPLPAAASPARRAQLTLQGLCEGWPELGRLPHRTEEDLYTFSRGDLVDWLRAQQAGDLFVIGHNPAFTGLVNYICGRPALDNLPTCSYIHLHMKIGDWQLLEQGCGELADYVFARELPDA